MRIIPIQKVLLHFIFFYCDSYRDRRRKEEGRKAKSRRKFSLTTVLIRKQSNLHKGLN